MKWRRNTNCTTDVHCTSWSNYINISINGNTTVVVEVVLIVALAVVAVGLR